MRFLQRFGICSAVSVPSQLASPFPLAPPVNQPEPISDVERLTRYVMNHDHYSATKNEVKFRAFLPSPSENSLSIMRSHELSESDVWAQGQATADVSGRTVCARGDVTAPLVRESSIDPWQLVAVPDEPPVRHASINGWPPAAERDIRKSLAQQLRAKATPHGRPS